MKDKYRGRITDAENIQNRLRKASVPIKYNVILDIAELNEFERDESPLEPMLVLNQVRNELVHFEPEWIQGGGKEYTENEHGFEKSIKGRFELNPITPDGGAFFPDQCMSYSCTEWSVRNSRNFVQTFSQRIGVELQPNLSLQ